MPITDTEYLCRNKNIYCKCGKLRSTQLSPQSKIGVCLYRTCGDTKCDSKYGIKRPEHSLVMKNQVINGSEKFKRTLIKPGDLHNKEVNSINFKKKRLISHNISVANKTNDEINNLYSVLLAEFNTSISRRKSDIISRYDGWEEQYKLLILLITNNVIPTDSWLDSLTDKEIDIIWRRIHGVNTIRNFTRIKSSRSKWFKQELLSNFKYNTKQQESVFTKSGLEKQYITFFEDNHIPWEYETIVLETINKSGFYIPDFLIKFQNNTILLETKGSFYRQNIIEYINNKVQAGINFCKEHGYVYVLTQKNPDINGNFIKYSLING